MFKALLRSRVQAILGAMKQGGKKGKNRSKAGLFGYGLLMVYAGFCFLVIFYMMADTLCAPLMAAGLGWLYHAIMGIMALALGVIGSVFTAQTQLFEAKDNEMLLAMPIPPSYILGSRMVALYGQSFLSGAVVLLPSLVAYLRAVSPSPMAIGLCVASMFVLPLLSLTLSCILGWLVAMISSRMRNKSLITVIISIAFLMAYIYFYSRMQQYLDLLIANGPSVAAVVQGKLYPFYQMGLAELGNPRAFGIFALCAAVPFAIAYWILSRSFIRIATTRRGAAKIRYKERTLKVSSPDRALLLREMRHLWGSPMYLLNGAFGSVFLLIGAVAGAVKGEEFLATLTVIPGFSKWLPLIGCACLCFVASMNIVTAPSISLEGKTLWVAQTLPVSGWQVLRAKLRLHMLVTAIPSLLCSAVLAVLLRSDPLMTAMLLVTPVVFTWLCAALGLILNLLMPRLDWVNEAQAVKRSGSAMIAIFADWGIVLLAVLVFVLTRKFLSIALFVLVMTAIFAVVAWIMIRWLRGRGADIFAHL